MIKKLIIFLIRRRLHLNKHQPFWFDNQRYKGEHYYFTSTNVIKVMCDGREETSNVSLNWLLDDECKITKKEI